MFFPCPRSRLRICSRETGSSVPSRVNPVILHTQAESGTYSRDSSRFPRRRPHIPTSGHSRIYRVTQLRADEVHCQESTGTGPVVLKKVPVTGAASSCVTMDHILCASLFPHSLMVPSGHIFRKYPYVCVFCIFFPFILDFNGRTSRGHTGRR